MNALFEFDKQVQNLIQKGYPKVIGREYNTFIGLFKSLRTRLEGLNVPDADFEKGLLPFVIVVKSNLIPTDKAMALVERKGKTGITKLFPLLPTDFNPIPDIKIPGNDVYLLMDIDRGKNNINKPPSKAMEEILTMDRSPLTIDEGVAIMTQYPDFLLKNNCFSLLASRHTGDKRVPAIWINANKNPNLGWCWNGNPHTWLGSASCKNRLG